MDNICQVFYFLYVVAQGAVFTTFLHFFAWKKTVAPFGAVQLYKLVVTHLTSRMPLTCAPHLHETIGVELHEELIAHLSSFLREPVNSLVRPSDAHEIVSFLPDFARQVKVALGLASCTACK